MTSMQLDAIDCGTIHLAFRLNFALSLGLVLRHGIEGFDRCYCYCHMLQGGGPA
jgi:hypothetical protein